MNRPLQRRWALAACRPQQRWARQVRRTLRRERTVRMRDLGNAFTNMAAAAERTTAQMRRFLEAAE